MMLAGLHVGVWFAFGFFVTLAYLIGKHRAEQDTKKPTIRPKRTKAVVAETPETDPRPERRGVQTTNSQAEEAWP